jgi:hypothetical protein
MRYIYYMLLLSFFSLSASTLFSFLSSLSLSFFFLFLFLLSQCNLKAVSLFFYASVKVQRSEEAKQSELKSSIFFVLCFQRRLVHCFHQDPLPFHLHFVELGRNNLSQTIALLIHQSCSACSLTKRKTHFICFMKKL